MLVSNLFSPNLVAAGAQLMALGHVYTGAFTENESLWHELKEAGEVSLAFLFSFLSRAL